MTGRTGYESAVLAWAGHLRAGGTTPWSDFDPADGVDLPSPPRAVPGAAQLELVRRVALTGAGPEFAALAERILDRAAPGRGPARLTLPHPEAPLTGLRPVQPDQLPAEELIRVGVGVLADLVLTAPVRATKRRRAPRLPSVRRRAAAPQEAYVPVPGVDELLTRAWAARVRLGSGVRWRRFVDRWAGADRLPPGVDPVLVAARAAERVGNSRVHVHLGASTPRLSWGVAEAGVVPPSLTVEGTDLLRRLNPLLALRAPAGQRAQLRAQAAHLLMDDGGLRSLPVPVRHRVWAEEQARRVADALGSGGYSVHGDPADLHTGAGARPLRATDVLDRLVAALMRAEEAGPASRRQQRSRPGGAPA